MAIKKQHWLWNTLLIITVLICLTALTLHYKNWIKVKPGSLRIVSGFYHVDIPFQDLDSVLLVDRIPPMERLNGFSAFEKEKGIFRNFKDSLTNKKVNVFVDNISQQKIKLVYRDSSELYVNETDSLPTVFLYNAIKNKVSKTTVPD